MSSSSDFTLGCFMSRSISGATHSNSVGSTCWYFAVDFMVKFLSSSSNFRWLPVSCTLPKSLSLAPPMCRSTFELLMSRCTRPSLCMYDTPERMSRRILRVCAICGGPSRLRRRRRSMAGSSSSTSAMRSFSKHAAYICVVKELRMVAVASTSRRNSTRFSCTSSGVSAGSVRTSFTATLWPSQLALYMVPKLPCPSTALCSGISMVYQGVLSRGSIPPADDDEVDEAPCNSLLWLWGEPCC
mmetsp:Transcript_46256/g.116485  ORF Transcript_46256/g.116485 Transcript_46256/m.116485 type:complete len:242 (+) Transcript_46256:828-1553(+)